MKHKQTRKLQALILAVTVVASLAWFFADQLGLGSLRFQTFPQLNEENISAADLGKLISLLQECFEEDRRKNLYNYYIEIQHPQSDEYFRKYLRDKVEGSIHQARLTKKSSFRLKKDVTVLKKGAEFIGLYSCADERDITHGSRMIYDVCLTAKMRGKGLGKSLMIHAMDHCQQAGKDLTLTVYKDNTPAIALYKKLNFSIVPMPSEAGDEFEYFNKYLMVYQPAQK
jgi:GNAT superfamily N-acetyltransferase